MPQRLSEVFNKKQHKIKELNYQFRGDEKDAIFATVKKRSKRMLEYYAYSAKDQRGNQNGDNLEERSEAHFKNFRDLGPRILRDRKQVCFR